MFTENILLDLDWGTGGLLIGKNSASLLLLRQWRLIRLCLDEISIHRVFVMPSSDSSLSLFVNGVMYFKLKKINMVESIKSGIRQRVRKYNNEHNNE